MHEEHPNPFYPCTVMRCNPLSRCVKCVFGIFVLLPLRLSIIAFALLICYLFAKFGSRKSKQELYVKPPTGWRNVIAIRCISCVVWITMFFCGFRFKVTGPTPAPAYETPVYIAAPRSNFLNVLIPFLLRTSPVLNQRVRDLPILGPISKVMKTVFYKGEHYTPDMITEINRRALEAGWLPILLFPEEAYTNGKTLIHFPTELFQFMKPVQPVVVSYSRSTKSHTVKQSITIGLILQILCTFRHRLAIHYLEVIYPDVRRENAKEFTSRVRDKLADSFGVYTSEHSKEDIQLMTYAKDLNLPPLTGVVEFMALKKEYDSLTLDIAEKELVRFFQIDTKKKGCITLADFASFLKEPTSEVSSIFKNYNLDANENLSFRNFLEGNLKQTNGPLLSPREDGDKGTRDRPTNMLIQRHSVSLENGINNF